LIYFADSKENLGIIGCQLIDGKGKFLPESKRNIPKPKVALKKLVGDAKAYYANQLKIDDIGEVEVLVGAFMFLEKEVYDAVGGFDEDYFMYGEDIDLSYKMLKAGYDNYYYGDATIIHYKGESTLRDKKYAQRFFGAMQIFYKKHFKQNVFFDMVVWLGIKLAFTLRKVPKINAKTIPEYIFISNKRNEKLEAVIPSEVILKTDLMAVKINSEIIFDANVYSYKEIINFITHSEKELTYKILPNNSNFIIGSNDGFTQGKVVFLK
jgi:GT2 family glycosyltransferase